MASPAPWWNADLYASFDKWSANRYCCIAPTLYENNRRCRVSIDLGKALYLKEAAEALPLGPERIKAIKAFIWSLNCDFSHQKKLGLNVGDVQSALADRYERHLGFKATTAIKTEVQTISVQQILPETKPVISQHVLRDPAQSLIPFVPHPSDTHTVRAELAKDVDPKYQVDGQVYCATWPDLPGYVKIGYTAGSASDRIANQAANCFPGMRLEAALRFEFPEKIERLIHRQLHISRHEMPVCKFCERGHIEWFKISTFDAIEVMSDWYKVTQKEPLYGSDRILTLDWDDRIFDLPDDLSATVLLASLTTPPVTTAKAIEAAPIKPESDGDLSMAELMIEHMEEMRLLRKEMKAVRLTTPIKEEPRPSGKSSSVSETLEAHAKPAGNASFSSSNDGTNRPLNTFTPIKPHMPQTSFPPTPPTTVQKPLNGTTNLTKPIFSFGGKSASQISGFQTINSPTATPLLFSEHYKTANILTFTPTKTPGETTLLPNDQPAELKTPASIGTNADLATPPIIFGKPFTSNPPGGTTDVRFRSLFEVDRSTSNAPPIFSFGKPVHAKYSTVTEPDTPTPKHIFQLGVLPQSSSTTSTDEASEQRSPLLTKPQFGTQNFDSPSKGSGSSVASKSSKGLAFKGPGVFPVTNELRELRLNNPEALLNRAPTASKVFKASDSPSNFNTSVSILQNSQDVPSSTTSNAWNVFTGKQPYPEPWASEDDETLVTKRIRPARGSGLRQRSPIPSTSLPKPLSVDSLPNPFKDLDDRLLGQPQAVSKKFDADFKLQPRSDGNATNNDSKPTSTNVPDVAEIPIASGETDEETLLPSQIIAPLRESDKSNVLPEMAASEIDQILASFHDFMTLLEQIGYGVESTQPETLPSIITANSTPMQGIHV